ncbi:ribonuclease domain-containing protein [Brackiella oedipodis]|uniref:ribonuclease domain-containing protein n=1 Tax=Brackiella oedipodis TaxID=124225 RepID=UPI00068539E0|nr:ribonuclease domain-containing protein [Brackiella oedipodis]
MSSKRWVLSVLAASSLVGLGVNAQASENANADLEHVTNAQACIDRMQKFNEEQLDGQIDAQELAYAILHLQKDNRLPQKYLSKHKARSLGWVPGAAFDDIEALKGKALGGDHFGNYENKLPRNGYHEADLDYQGKQRNAKRLVYTPYAKPAYVTINHYQSFIKVPSCQ